MESLWRLPQMPSKLDLVGFINLAGLSIGKASGLAISIELEPDLGSAASCAPCQGGGTIYLPEGLLLRLIFYCRSVLTYYTRTEFVRFIDSPFDGIGEEGYRIPIPLRPCLEDFETDSDFIEQFRQQWLRWKFSPEWASELETIVKMAVQHIINHELAHLMKRHFDLMGLKSFEESIVASRHELEHARPDWLEPLSARRAFELDADNIQGIITAKQHIHELHQSNGDPLNMALRDSYALFLLFAFFDVKRRQMSNFKTGGYYPPQIRFQLVKRAYFRVVNDEAPYMLEFMQKGDSIGFEKAFRSIQAMELDMHTRKPPFEMEREDGVLRAAHGMLYGGVVGVSMLAAAEKYAISELQLSHSLISRHQSLL